MIQYVFKYWGLDWLIYGLIVGNLWLLDNNKLKTAYILGATASLFGIGFNYWIDSFCGILANVVFLILHLRNLYYLKCLKLPS